MGSMGLAGSPITKSGIYLVQKSYQLTPGGGDSPAACADNNDVVLTGGCIYSMGSPSRPSSYPINNDQPGGKAAWVCATDGSPGSVSVSAWCLVVP